jgi:2-polyprenyl-3-methyl-5-hydroxy-6-metoxy-1,4-benzoquinol methylase
MNWINQAWESLDTGVRVWELRQIIKKRTWRHLDLGCGQGKLVKSLRQMGIGAVGYDKQTGGAIENLKLKDKFEVISLYHVLEHLDDPAAVLKQTRRWLKPGGVLVVEIPLVGNLSEKWLGKDYLAYSDKTHKHFFTQKNLIKLTRESGWQLRARGITWYQFPLHLVTASFRSGMVKGLAGVVLWLPFKILSMLGLNQEIARGYFIQNNEEEDFS